MNNDAATNDQWQPVITFKPDGAQLFVGWYDRLRDLESNSTIQVDGVFAKLPVTNTVSFANSCLISSSAFPPVFTGTTMCGTNQFDTCHPPSVRNDGTNCPIFGGHFASHMGDYDSAVADNYFVYYTWGDNRLTSMFTNPAVVTRNQADVRFAKIPWPR